MIDLHTHILPGMDDGAKDVKTSLALLRMESAQGVGTVVLTPHFYRDREEPQHFLTRRASAAQALAAAIKALPEPEQNALPRLALGAEIAWVPHLADWSELPELCLGPSAYFLLELPFYPWTDQLINQLYELPGRTGLTPVLAHIERYLRSQKPQYLEAVLDLGFPVQVSAEPLLHLTQRGPVLRLLRTHRAQLVASDAHDPTTRPPNLGEAFQLLRRKLGEEKSNYIESRTSELLTPRISL